MPNDPCDTGPSARGFSVGFPKEPVTPVPTTDADVARLLLSWENARAGASSTVAADAARVCEDVVGWIAELVGETGARALLERSIVLVQRELPQVELPRPLVGIPGRTLHDVLHAYEPRAEGVSAALVAQLVSLTATLIGRGLVDRMLQRHRPDLFPVDGPKDRP